MTTGTQHHLEMQSLSKALRTCDEQHTHIRKLNIALNEACTERDKAEASIRQLSRKNSDLRAHISMLEAKLHSLGIDL